jgi:hypothetical protein
MDEDFDSVPPYQLTYYQTPKLRLEFRSNAKLDRWSASAA